jgi:BirA family biotin operon repressor/biotin-[acetyl-CoA-carboxylase] ligase
MFKIYNFKEVNSTNILAKEYEANSVLVAEVQISGKGRFERKWDSPKGGLWFSIVLKADREAFEYTFISCLAVLESLKIKGIVKWPNDVYYDDKKVCGILSEIIKDKVIIGIGINVNNNIPDGLKDKAISLKEIKGTEIELDELLKNILSRIEELMKKDKDGIIRLYKERCGILGKEIIVKTVENRIQGKAINIDDKGRLIVEKEGKKIGLEEGDVSIL